MVGQSTLPEDIPHHDSRSLMTDWCLPDAQTSYGHVHVSSVAAVGRSAEAVRVIARLLNNSIQNPEALPTPTLDIPAQTGLLVALEVVGDHLGCVYSGMCETMAALPAREDQVD